MPAVAPNRDVLISAVRASIEALKVAVSVMELYEADYHMRDHERWAVAYRWVVAANDLVWQCRLMLYDFDLASQPDTPPDQ
jgi:hypothetical protein